MSAHYPAGYRHRSPVDKVEYFQVFANSCTTFLPFCMRPKPLQFLWRKLLQWPISFMLHRPKAVAKPGICIPQNQLRINLQVSCEVYSCK